MDETLSLIIHGIELAKKLESNLPHLSEHPTLLSKSCEELMGVFRTAVQQLNSPAIISVSSHSPAAAVLQHESRLPPQQGADAVVQDWLSSSYTQAMDMLLRAQFSASSTGDLFAASASKQATAVLVPAAEDQINIIPPVSAAATPHAQDLRILEFGGIFSQKAGGYNSSSGVDHGEAGGSRSRTTSTATGAEVQMIEGTTTDQSDRSPASKRTSRRRAFKKQQLIELTLLRTYNIQEGWRGQAYDQGECSSYREYRDSTRRRLHLAKIRSKRDSWFNVSERVLQVHPQELLRVRSEETSAATRPRRKHIRSDVLRPPHLPSLLLCTLCIPSNFQRPTITTIFQSTTTHPPSSWPAAEANINITTVEMAETTASSTGESSRPAAFSADLQLPMYYYKDFIGSGSSSAAAAGGAPGPSSQRGERSSLEQAKEGDLPVMDLADAMFNSGSSSNSMDSIFPSMGREN
ncbi:hypothetical protein Syun_000025 [Stephania yunnanensis]|uniref:Uncharacterized protein n=1 Tax=Stephania yunnanensis TaxID=152371 RepID=A0AAP0LC85_9MAGN